MYKRIKIFNLIRAAAAVCALSLLLLAGCAVPGGKNVKNVSDSALLLNTVVTVTLYGTDDRALIDECFDLCREYELIFSRTDERSELYRLNERRRMQVSDELLSLLKTALHYCEISGGAFDITLGEVSELYGFSSGSPAVPKESERLEALSHVGWRHILIDGSTVTVDDPETVIDLGAIAKGYIADRLREHILAAGQKSAVIDLGGNILLVGSKPDGSDFRVGIQYPFEQERKSIAVIEASDLSVVTSGIYERSFEENGVLYHHILSSETGLPVQNRLLAVSIVSPMSVDGDALSTACFALGLDRGLELIETLDGIEAVFVTDDYALHPSSGFDAMRASQ